jgi:ribosomal protein L37E
MIDLGRIAGLYTHGHQLHAYCRRCDRWKVLDLAQLIVEGQGDRRLPVTVRCRRCGDVGQLQVRPPMADWTGVLSTWGGPP